jgi:hypothetical protein
VTARWLALGLLGGLGNVGCGRAWNHDESERITQVMRGEAFSPELPGAAGIALNGNPPEAELGVPSRGYEIPTFRRHRLSSVRIPRNPSVRLSPGTKAQAFPLATALPGSQHSGGNDQRR